MLRIAHYTETQLRRACKRPDHQMGHRENQPALLFSTKILQTAGASGFTPETSSIKSHSALSFHSVMFERFPILHLRAITALMITGLLIHICWPAQDSEEQRSTASTIPIMLPSHAFDQPERADSPRMIHRQRSQHGLGKRSQSVQAIIYRFSLSAKVFQPPYFSESRKLQTIMT